MLEPRVQSLRLGVFALSIAAAACGGASTDSGARAIGGAAQVVTVAPGDNTLVSGLGGPNGYGALDLTTLPMNCSGCSLDDGYWPLDVSAVFPHGINYFGTRYDAASQLFVGTNGYITFSGGYKSYIAEGIPSMTVPIIAVFYADQDFSHGGHAWVAMDANPSDPTLTLTYEGVPAYPADDLSKVNNYQIRLHNTGGNATDGDGVAIEFRYNRIDYLLGTASDGKLATAGWADGKAVSGKPTQVYGDVVGSGTADMALNATANLAYSNLVPPQAGVYVWKPLQIHARAVSSPQSALPGRAFPQPLIVDVTDDSGVPVAGATVKFAPPVSGASASLVSRTAVTDASGTAQVEAYAGVTTGTYDVQAFVVSGGYSIPVTFALTNLVEPPLTVLLDEGFESGLGGWTTATDSGSSFWHVLTNPENLRISPALVPSLVSLPDAGHHLAAAGGTHVAWFGDGSTGTYLGSDYPPSQVAKGGGTSAAVQAGSLVTPSLDLTAFSAATLEFDSWWEVEGADPATDDRMSLTAVSGGGSTPLTTLNPTFHTTTPAAVAVSSGGIAATPVWRHYVVDLTGVTGRAIQLRFGFDSVTTSANAFRGWSLDNVVVRGGTEVPAPSVGSVSPAVGTAGDVVVVTGTSFAQGARFYIGTTEVTAVTVIGSTTAYLEVPAVAEGLHDITVVNPDGKLNIGADAFTYTSTASPAIGSLSPASAAPGVAQVVTISGSGFAAGAQVQVGGQSGSSLTVLDANTIQVTLPGLAEGTYTVQVTSATGQAGTAYAAYTVARQEVGVTIDAATLSATYDGSAKHVTATTSPGGLPVTVYYDGSTTAPTAAGSYAVVAAVETAQYHGAATGTLVIGKGTAAVTLGSLSATYDGSPHAATATTSPTGKTVTFTYDGSPTAPTAVGSYEVVGTISDANYQGSASGTLVIGKGTATVTLGSLTATYDGSPHAATATTSPSNLTVTFTYEGSPTAPTAVGSYAVVGTISDASYQGSASGTLVIGKGTATVTLGSLTATYDGSPHAATATTSPSNLTVTFTYEGSPTAPTAAGSYAVVGTISDANYQGSASGTLVIGKALATVTLGSLSATYDGSPHAATATTSPSNRTVTFTYDGSPTAPTAAGSYEVVGTISDANYQGSASGTLVVGKATATVALGSLTATYDGSPHAATATTSPSNLTVTFTYEGSPTAPTAAGSYAVVGTISDANYQGSASGTLVVGKAMATVALGSLSATYDGSPHAATATTSPSNLTVTFTYEGSPTAPTAAGSYAVVGTISDANHQGSASGTLVIGKALATVALGSLTATYDGAPHAATATTSPSDLTVTFTYDGSPTAPTAAGSYEVVGTISDANHQGSASGTLVIGKGTATMALGSLTATYDGAPHAATATTSPSDLTVTFTYDGSPTAPTAAGSYAVVGTISDANYQGSVSGTLVIGRGEATVALGSLSTTYDGAPHAATATTSPAGLTVTFTYDGSPTAPTAAGSYAVVGTISDADHQGSASGTLVIGKALAMVTLGALSATYDRSPHAAMAITSPASLAVTFTYDGAATAPTHAGTYAVVGTVSDANYQGSASGSLVLAKAPQAISFTPPAAATYGDAGVDLSGHASGGDSGQQVTFSVVSGPGALSGTTLGFTGAGDLVVRASQAGDGDYLAAADVDATIAVAAAGSTVALAAEPASPIAGQAMAFTVTVTGAGTPSGTVAVLEGGVTLATGTLSGGAATLALAGGLHAGTHALTATYAGDGAHGAAAPASLELPVGKAGTAVALSSSRADARVDQPVTFQAAVSAAAPGAGTPTGTVTFTDGATTLGTGTLSGGVASLTIPSLSHGTHAIAAAYAGDDDFVASTGSLSGGQVVPESPPVAGAGKAVAFDGATQDARVEDPDDVLSAVRTVELWFSAAAGDAPACLVQRGEGSDLRFGLCLTAGRDGLEVRRGTEVTPVPLAIASGWHHLALVDGGTATTLFLDGQEAASLEGGFGPGAAPAGAAPPAAGPALVIGAALAGSGATDRFPGAVDEVRLWSAARNAGELTAGARQPVSGAAEGLLALWRMDEGEGASLYDAGPSHLVAALSAPGEGTWIDSGAWRLRTTHEERALPAFLAGYHPDGEAFTVTVVTAPAHGTATADGVNVTYTPAPGFVGTDSFTCEVSGGGPSSRYTTEVSVTHIDVCEVTTDCAGGEVCSEGRCVPPRASSSSGGGCGCGSGGGGASLLAALSLLALLPRRRRSR